MIFISLEKNHLFKCELFQTTPFIYLQRISNYCRARRYRVLYICLNDLLMLVSTDHIKFSNAAV